MKAVLKGNCTDRTEITAQVVTEFDRLLADGTDLATIATRLGITPYVAGLLVQTAGRQMPHIKPRRTARRVRNIQRGVDAATIRSIQRMLDVGWLAHQEIAREAGVSANLVSHVASGRRSPITVSYSTVDAGETLVREPIRCGGCGAVLSVVPCRACRTHVVSMADAAVCRLGIPQSGFSTSRLFAVILGRIARRYGVMAAQELLATLSAELSDFLDAGDKRGHLIERCEHYYDVLAEPAKPGRNGAPVLRGVIRPLIGQVYDGAVRKLESQEHAA